MKEKALMIVKDKDQKVYKNINKEKVLTKEIEEADLRVMIDITKVKSIEITEKETIIINPIDSLIIKEVQGKNIIAAVQARLRTNIIRTDTITVSQITDIEIEYSHSL